MIPATPPSPAANRWADLRPRMLSAAVLLAIGYGGLRLMLGAALAPSPVGVVAPLVAIPGLAFYLLIRVLLQGLIFLLLVFAVLSWVQPGAPVMGTLDRLCTPILKPIRRFLPLIVLAHGGPASRDVMGFDWWAQALASRGYAVFQPQFRGSEGFGLS